MMSAALDIAADEVAVHGWNGLQVQVVAGRLGVSRQTLYNAFTNKHGLALALILRLTTRFLDGVEEAISRSDEVFEQWRAAVLYTLDTAACDPLLKSVLTADGQDEFLPLLTRDAEPIISAAQDRLAQSVLDACPDLEPEIARDVAETATRLAISHIVMPLHPHERVADLIATMVSRYVIGAPANRAARSDPVGGPAPDEP